MLKNPDIIMVMINGKKYDGKCNETTIKKFKQMLQFSPGKALNFLKKNCDLKEVT